MEKKYLRLCGDYFLPAMFFFFQTVIWGHFIPTFSQNIECAVTDVSVLTSCENNKAVAGKKRPRFQE